MSSIPLIRTPSGARRAILRKISVMREVGAPSAGCGWASLSAGRSCPSPSARGALAEPRLGAARLHEGEPVLRRVRVGRGEDLDRVAVLQLVAERDELPVHLRADGVLADLRVDGVGDVPR